MTKEEIYRNMLDELSLIVTEDEAELELIGQAKEAIEHALAIDMLARHMLQVM